jgi:hypothetical protein
MKDVMKIRIAISALGMALILTMSSISYGQAVPAGVVATSPNVAGVGPSFSALDGVLHYSLSASEVVQYGYYGAGEANSSAALSGNVSYSAKSVIYPFSMLFAGGVLLPNQAGQGVSTYESIAASQGWVTRDWVFGVSDSFSFLPQSPTTGLSGIPGVGDLGVIPIQGPGAGPAGGILSVEGDRYSNALSGSVERQIGHAMSVSGSGSYAILNFLGSSPNGLNSTEIGAGVSLNRRLDARSSVSLNGNYATYSYGGPNAGPAEPDFQSKSVSVSYSRLLSRAFSASVYVGPQWVSSSDSALIPSSTNVSVGASLSYTHRFTNASVGFSRGVNAGSGVLPGALSDSVNASVGRSYGRNWVASASGAYVHSTGLTAIGVGGTLVPVNEQFDTVYGGLQVTRRINTHFSGYVSYSVQHQSNNYSLAAQDAFSGTSQTFGVGISFSPRSTRLGQF